MHKILVIYTQEKDYGATSSTRSVFAGGYLRGIIKCYRLLTIASTGNAADFGDLVMQDKIFWLSDSHGGLGGF